MEDKETQVRRLREDKRALERLADDRGWQLVMRTLQGQREVRRNAVLGQRVEGFGDCFKLATLSAEIGMLSLALNIRTLLIEGYTNSIQEFMEEESENG